jgi:hypothetical protein
LAELWVLGDESGGRRSEAVAIGRRRDCICPALGQLRIELLRAAVGGTRSLRAMKESQLCLLGTVPAVQHPSDPQMFEMGHAAREHNGRLPGVSKFLVTADRRFGRHR